MMQYTNVICVLYVSKQKTFMSMKPPLRNHIVTPYNIRDEDSVDDSKNASMHIIKQVGEEYCRCYTTSPLQRCFLK